MRGLIVEDDPAAAADLATILEDLGHLVSGPVANVADAISLFSAGCDFALVDIQLSGSRDGVDLVAAIDGADRPAIIFVTSRSDAKTLQRVRLLNPDGYLLKPFSKDSVFAAVELAVASTSVDIADQGVLSAAEMEQINRYIVADISGAHSLDDLAWVLGLGRSVFAERFKATTGISPHSHLVRLRMAEARTLLRTTKNPIREVARSVGYESSSHFSTSFRDHIGLSPAAYRRSISSE